MLLRFTLSEHFLNVEQLLENKNDRIISPPVKKNAPLTNKPKEDRSTEDIAHTAQLENLEDIKNNWQNILKILSARLGSGTAGLLGSAEPVKFINGILELSFKPESQMSINICKNNGRLEQIQSVLSEYFSAPVKLELTSGIEHQETLIPSVSSETSTQKRNQILNDPAVKTIITELGASIAKIEVRDTVRHPVEDSPGENN